MGRMLTFMGRVWTDFAPSQPNTAIAGVTGVGVDESTALLLSYERGDVIAVGRSEAFVCTSNSSPEVCDEQNPLTFKGNIEVYIRSTMVFYATVIVK